MYDTLKSDVIDDGDGKQSLFLPAANLTPIPLHADLVLCGGSAIAKITWAMKSG
jgi:hypothetical protein